jgi:hypothetical protein
MIAFIGVAKQVDVYFAQSQRRQLGLCESCGGIYEASTCSKAGCPLASPGGSAGDDTTPDSTIT